MIKKIFKSKEGKAGLVYTGTNFFNAALPFFLLPVLTSKLTEAEYGIVAMVMVVVSVVLPLITLGVTSSISAAYFRADIKNFPQYLGNCLLLIFLGFIAVNALFIFTGDIIRTYTDIPSYWYYACTFIALFNTIIEMNLVIYRVKFEAKKFAIVKILQTILTFGLTYYFVISLGYNWEGVITAKLVILLLFTIYSIYHLFHKKKLVFKVNFPYVKKALSFGVPLIPHMLAMFVITLSDRLFITNILDLSQTGVYVIAYQIGSVIDLLCVSLNLAWAPWLYEKLKDLDKSRDSLRKTTSIALIGLPLIALLFYLVSPLVVALFVNESFTVSMDVLAIIIFSFVFQGYYFLFINYLLYYGKTKTISTITFSIALLNILLNYVFITKFGILGGAFATLISFALRFVIVFIVCNKKYEIYSFSRFRIFRT